MWELLSGGTSRRSPATRAAQFSLFCPHGKQEASDFGSLLHHFLGRINLQVRLNRFLKIRWSVNVLTLWIVTTVGEVPKTRKKRDKSERKVLKSVGA
jgi:hypothetical protein